MSRDDDRLTCGNCRFWDEIRKGDGHCRRYAPRPVAEMAVTHPETENVSRYFIFPVVAVDDWCGELDPLPVEDE